MSANVETMFWSGREVPWHGLGTQVAEAPNSAEALKLAELDWKVEKKPIYTDAGKEIPNYFANTRSSDESVLGIVGKNYKVVQNVDAFSFTDNLLGETTKYETAGSLNGGKNIWLLAKMETTKMVGGDDLTPYLCFSNNHDGTGTVKVCMTPIRVVCNNTLNYAFDTASRIWRTRHVGNLDSKMIEAAQTLQMAKEYIDTLKVKSEELATSRMSKSEVTKVLEIMFPAPEDPTVRQEEAVQSKRAAVMYCMLAPDLANFVGTKWQFLNAVSDYATHVNTTRKDNIYTEGRWSSVICGNPVMDLAYSIVNE